MENERIPKDVYNILEGREGEDGKDRWIRIGSAFTNKDGSINAYLDVFPRDGKIQIRDRKQKSPNNNKHIKETT